MSTTGIIKALAKQFVKMYNIDESQLHEVVDTAIFARENINIRIGYAVHVAALYVLARRGIDIAKYMPRYAPKRARIAILLARTLAAKENRDDVDEFIRAYAYAIYLAAKLSLPAEAVERAKGIIWNLRYKINGDPLVIANFALHNTMNNNTVPVSMPCPAKVKVKKAGIELELVPRRVWTVSMSRDCSNPVKLGLFQDPLSGEYFRAGVPPDYPDCP